MEISKQAKGFVDYSDEYNPVIPADEYPEPSEEEILAMDQRHEAELREIEENARIAQEWEKLGQQNLKVIRDTSKSIGERLEYLFAAKKIERIHFARQIGVSRSTLFRYCTGYSTPSEKKLLMIIDALDMSVADFCYEPQDTPKWKSHLEKKVIKKNDIFELKDVLLEQLSSNSFTYQYNGDTLRLPCRYTTILKALLESSFRILDLLPHDQEATDTE